MLVIIEDWEKVRVDRKKNGKNADYSDNYLKYLRNMALKQLECLEKRRNTLKQKAKLVEVDRQIDLYVGYCEKLDHAMANNWSELI